MSKERIWFHCASLGEFEQCRTIIEKIKTSNPEVSIILSFFSPSGYEIRKDYPHANLVTYLPIDTPQNAKRFISIIKPSLTVFIKYEFWLNYINALSKSNIPFILVSGIFRENQIFFKPYGFSFRNTLKQFNHLFVQDKNSLKLLDKINVTNASIANDTRFDRVHEISKEVYKDEIIESFKNDTFLLIAGSTWDKDEDLLQELTLNQNIKLIIVPHDVNEQRITSIQKRFTQAILYSEASKENVKRHNTLIINQTGILSKIYRFANITYVGGGFNNGIHNILEPAIYGLPVIFGKKYNKFKEAKDLIQSCGAYSIANKKELLLLIKKFNMSENLINSGNICKNYTQTNIGGTKIVTSHIEKLIHNK